MYIQYVHLFMFTWLYYTAGLVNSLRSNLTRKEGYLVQLLGLIYLKGHVFAKFLIRRETTTVFTFYVLHRKRYFNITALRIFFPLTISGRFIRIQKAYNYRFFYNKLQDIEKYRLGSPKSFHYLNQSNCYELDGVNDAQEYLATRRAMDIIGIGEQEQVHLLINLWSRPYFEWLIGFLIACDSFRSQYSGLQLQFFTLAISISPKGRKQIPR